jgi:hypothetical protein
MPTSQHARFDLMAEAPLVGAKPFRYGPASQPHDIKYPKELKLGLGV